MTTNPEPTKIMNPPPNNLVWGIFQFRRDRARVRPEEGGDPVALFAGLNLEILSRCAHGHAAHAAYPPNKSRGENEDKAYLAKLKDLGFELVPIDEALTAALAGKKPSEIPLMVSAPFAEKSWYEKSVIAPLGWRDHFLGLAAKRKAT